MDERIEKLITDATSGLQDDPELRLDVSAELRSHLEATAEEYAEAGDAEPVEQALQTFGSPLEIAGELLQANKRRMRLRALARLTLRALLIPAAFIIALYVGYVGLAHSWQRVTLIYADTLQRLAPPNVVGCMSSSLGAFRLPLSSLLNRNEERFHKLLADDPATSTSFMMKDPYAEDKFRDQPLDQYIHGLQNDPWRQMLYGRLMIRYVSSEERDIPDRLRYGEQLDPDNALYDYLLAASYMKKGIRCYWSSGCMSYTVTDPTMVARGLTELRKGNAKPYLKTYHREYLQSRYALLPLDASSENYYFRLRIPVTDIYNEYSLFRVDDNGLTAFAKYCAEHGRGAEAEAILRDARKYAQHLANGDGNGIQLCVAGSFAEQNAQSATKIYRSLNNPIATEQAENEYLKLRALFKQREQNSLNGAKDFSRRIQPRVQPLLLDNVFTSSSITPNNLAPTRRLEQVFVEEVGVSILLLLGLVAMVWTSIESGYYLLHARHAQAAPLLLLPGWRDIARILGAGVLLPLLAYGVYTHIPILSGREYSVGYIWPRYCIEFGILLPTLMIIPYLLTDRMVRRRCKAFGVPVATQAKSWFRRFSLYMFTLWLVFMPNLLGQYLKAFLPPKSMSDGLFLTLLFVFTILIIVLLFLSQGKESLRLYYGTVARSLIPIQALTIILVAGIALPYLRATEQHCIHEDRLVFPRVIDANVPSVTEAELINDFQPQLLRILNGTAPK